MHIPVSKIALLVAIAVSSQSYSETIRLRPSDSSSVRAAPISAEAQEKQNQQVLLSEAEKLREQSLSDKKAIQDLQDLLRQMYVAVDRESAKAAYRGGKYKGEVALGEWHLDATKTLYENMQMWRHQAEEMTDQEIPFVWELSGWVPLNTPAKFYGTWRDALKALSLAFEENGWGIEIEIAKANNVVIFRPQ